jgi:hypothetical protein
MPAQHKTDFAAYPVWADRLAAFRNTDRQDEALRSIADEALRAGDLDHHYAATCAADGCEASLAELDQLLADDFAENSRMSLPADYFWRDSPSAIEAGMGE